MRVVGKTAAIIAHAILAPVPLAAAYNGALPQWIIAMAKSKKLLNFEQALRELEALVAAMESGEMTLEESLQAFEVGVRLTRECQQALQQAEQKVQLLLADDGTTTDFTNSDSDTPT